MCWTVRGDEDFRQSLDEMCMGINELAEQGAAIEVTFYDTEFDEEDAPEDEDARMERHFDASVLGGVVAEVDKLFAQRFDALVSSLEIGKPPRGLGGQGGSGHGGGRRPRHLH